MKCHKPNTDQEAVLNISANGFRCTEHILPDSASSNPNVLECFIPVSEGDHLKISGHFNGTVLHGAFDVLADGSFLGDKRIEGKGSELKYYKRRRLDLSKFFDNPRPQGYTSIYPPRDIIEGDLYVKALQSTNDDQSGEKLGLGSLAVIVSLNQKSDQTYHEPYFSTIAGEWRISNQVTVEETTNAGIVPSHELEVRVTDDKVHKNRQSKHRRHHEQIRFGSKPWAKFIFYYRDRLAIEAAGCVSRPDVSQALEEADLDSFVSANTEKNASEKNEAKVTPAKRSASDDGDSDSEDVVINPIKKKGMPPPSLTTSPTSAEPKKKKKLLGHALRLNTSDSLFMTPAPPESTPASGTLSSELNLSPKAASARGGDEEDDDFLLDSTEADRVTTQDGEALQQDFEPGSGQIGGVASTDWTTESRETGLRKINDEDVEGAAKEISSPESHPAIASTEGPSTENAIATILDNQTEKAAHDELITPQSEPRVKEELQNGITSATGSPTHQKPKDGRDIDTSTTGSYEAAFSTLPDDIRGLVSIQGSISQEILFAFFEKKGINPLGGLKAVDQVVEFDGAKYVLKRTPREGAEESSPKTNMQTTESQNASAQPHEQQTIRIKTEPADKPKTASQQTQTSSLNSTTSSPQVPNTPNSLPMKRAASISRESTPRKNAHIADLKARRDSLLAANVQKKKDTEAAKNALEEKQRKRMDREREQTEILEREIEMMERENAEEDEKRAEYLSATELEEAEMEIDDA